MSQTDPFAPSIAWRQGLTSPKREPVEVDVQDGRAEYLLSGPYRMVEGSKVEVVDGKLSWSASQSKDRCSFLEEVRTLPVGQRK